jgi:hypothetical protein
MFLCVCKRTALAATLIGAAFALGGGTSSAQSWSGADQPWRPCPAPCIVLPPAAAPAPAPTPPTDPAAKLPTPSTPGEADAAAVAAPTDMGQNDSSLADLGAAWSLSDSSVGYIDPAIPATQCRLRVDAAWQNVRPTRAEFFYPQGAPGGPGPPLPETSVDFQDINPYFEYALIPEFSAFIEQRVRFIQGDINGNHAGYGDLTTGFKWALFYGDSSIWTFQLKTYVPTGNPRLGLGTDHVSLEPGLLMFQQLSEQLHLEGEVRYWIPLGGTDFAGDVIRYGLGISYRARPPDAIWLAPVAEFVGWTVLDGKETVASSATDFFVKDASGDTIVNVKLGMRLGFGDRGTVYAGYGRALTGPTWYKDTVRVELRLGF